VHFPFDREPELISVPNRYSGFPIDDFGELERSVIVKIHGGVSGGTEAERWKEAFVVTEDHYIDYLSGAPIESLVPVQILAKLTESHCLFLGYGMRDWNLRVFLKRIWKGEPVGSKSWAIERERDVLESIPQSMRCRTSSVWSCDRQPKGRHRTQADCKARRSI
jgi:hypothetical protein